MAGNCIEMVSEVGDEDDAMSKTRLIIPM